VMDTLEKALRGAGAPARFTEGFNPHIRLSMGPALATGHEGLIELLDLDCVAPLRPPHLKAVNRLLPEGLQLLDARDLLPGAPSLGKLAAVARYRIGPPPDSAWPPDPSQLPDGLREGTLAWQVQDDSSLVVELNLRQEDGQVPRIRDVIEAAGVPRDEVPVVRVRRELIRLRPRLKAGARA